MNKQDLVAAIADKTGLTKKAAGEILSATLGTIQSAVATGDKVSIAGFGSWEMVHKPARTARNPGTGAEVDVAESWGPKFGPGSDFKELVNEGGKKAAEKAAEKVAEKTPELVDA